MQCKVLSAEFSKIDSAGWGGVRRGAPSSRHGQFCRCDCSVLVVAGVSLVLSVQSFRKLIMQVGRGDPLSFCVMMLGSCARKVVDCERFGEC